MISDAFTNSNGTALATHSAVWTTDSQFTIQSNCAVWPTGAGPGMAIHTTAMASANHYAETVLSTCVSNSYFGPIVRAASWSGSADRYWVEVQSGQTSLRKRVSGSNSPVADSGGVGGTAGDTFRLEANGSTLTVKKNGSTLFTVTDTSLTSGLYVGIAIQNTTGGGIDSFAADVLAAPSAPGDPTDLVPSAQTSTTMTLTATPAGSGGTATSWELEHSPDGTTWTAIASQPSNAWNVTYSGVSGHDHWRVRAVNGVGNSGWYSETIGFLNPATDGGGDLAPSGAVILSGLAISPASVARALAGSTVQFTASGVISGLSVSPLPASWSVISGSGSIDSSGLLTVGSLAGPVTVRATPTADATQSATATVAEVTNDMDDVSLQTLSYQGGILTGTILFNTTPGRVKITATYGGRTDEAIFGPGLTVPIAWNVGVQEQQVRFLTVGLPAS